MSLLNDYKNQVISLWQHDITQKQFLDFLYNRVGPFRVQKHIKDQFPSKWIDWLVVREQYNCNEYNHRNICACEVVFDIDLPGWLLEKEREQILRMTLRRLDEEWDIQPLVLYTGKGFHLHYFSMDIAQAMIHSAHPNETKQKIAGQIIADIRTDMMKWNHATMIAIECSYHWKRQKERIRPLISAQMTCANSP